MQTKWNFTDMFSGDNDPKIEKNRKLSEQKTNAFVKKWKQRTDYLEDPKILVQALQDYEAWTEKYAGGGDEPYYFGLRFTQNQTDTKVKAKMQLSDDFTKKLQNEIRFFSLSVSKIPEKVQSKFLNSPELAKYKHYLEMAFADAKYLLTEREEMIMSMKSSTSYSNWVEMTETFLVKEERDVLDESGKKEKKDFSTILTLISNKNKKIRDSAAQAFNDILKKYAEVAEVEINNVITNKKNDDIIRNVSRPDLLRHISDDIETEVVDAMLSAVEKRFDISARWYKIKAKLLGLPKLQYHERNVEYGHVDAKYSWEDSVTLTRKVFKLLDPDFERIFNEFIEKGRFDVFPEKGKSSGAFCAHYLLSQPTYILLNHTDKLRDVLTLAHEVGHGINNELVREKQHALYFGTPTSTAEVASTFMEDFVLKELLQNADDTTKLTLLTMKMDEEISTIFRQVACYRFEQALHERIRAEGYMSVADIGKLFQKHMKAYMGPAVEQSEGSENWWIYWSHIRSYFYVYSYAGGLLISKNLQHQVAKDPQSVRKVKEFLAAGYSESPKNIFKKMNVDITSTDFWNEGLKGVDEGLDEMEALMKKML
jgi:oligoendopeptidase F